MPWIRLNSSNFRDYIAPNTDVDGPTAYPNRGVFGEFGDPEIVSATVPIGATHNTLLSYYAFAYDNPYTTNKVRSVRITCIGRADSPPTNPAWSYVTQYITNSFTDVSTMDGDLISGVGSPYDYTGGVQFATADLSTGQFYYNVLDFDRTVERTFQGDIDVTATQGVLIFSSSTSIYTPDQIEGEVGAGEADYYIDVFVEGEDPPEPPGEQPVSYPVYEMEKGWSFDGNYIPHFLELNWYWGDNPVDMTGLQKVRVHGLTKGFSLLQLSVNGMETDMLDYLPYYSEPQIIDLPRQPYFVNPDYQPVTNYTDTAARGLSVQMKFEGRNQDIVRPEPSHVIQVLVIQSVPTGQRSH